MPGRIRSLAVLAPALAVAACSQGPPTADPVPPSTTTTTALAPPSTTTAPPATTTSPPPPPDLNTALAHWTATWALAGNPSTGELPRSVDPAAADTLHRLLRSSDTTPARTFVHAARAELDDGAAIIVNDCLLASPPIGDSPSAWFRGIYTTDDTLASVEVVSVGGCVPSEIAAAAIAGYEDHWDAATEYWAPADPTDPRIAATLTGDRLEFVRDLVAEHAAAGLELRGRPTTHPEVIEYRSPTEVVILDCQEVDPATGLFDRRTGERLAGIPPIADGQRDVRSAVMHLVEDQWKVAERAGETDVDCAVAPTVAGVPVV